MFRFLKSVSSKPNNVHFSKTSISQSNFHVIPCDLCKQEYNFLSEFQLLINNKSFNRYLSTEELTEIKNAIKKKKRVKKKYAELVEVKQNHSNVTKALVRNLSPQDVSRFSQKPEISLEKLHLSMNESRVKPAIEVLNQKLPTETKVTIKYENKSDKLFSQINLSPINNDDLEKKIEEEIEWELIQRNTENIDMFSNIDMHSLSDKLKKEFFDTYEENLSDNISINKILKTQKRSNTINYANIKENPKKRNKLRNEEIKKKDKEEKRSLYVQNILLLHTQICVACDLLNFALNKLQMILRKNRELKIVLNSAEPFNMLIHAFAKKGDVNTITNIVRMMTKYDINLVPQTFAGYFECFNYLPVTSVNNQKLKTVLHNFKSCGFTFQDLFSKCSYTKNERECVLKIINRIDSHFIPFYEPPTLYYSCNFLQNLNKNTNSLHSPAKSLLTNQELDECAKEQEYMELQYFHKIKSVYLPKPKKNNVNNVKFIRKKWNELQNQWRNSIRKGFLNGINHLKHEIKIRSPEDIIHLLYPCLQILKPDEYVDIVMNEIGTLLEGSDTYSPCIKILNHNLGTQVRYKCEIRFKEQNGVITKMNKLYKEYCKWYLQPELNAKSQNSRQYWQYLLYENAGSGPSTDINLYPWPEELIEKIGCFLLNIVVNNAKIGYEGHCEQAFHFIRRFRGIYDVQECKIHNIVRSLYRRSCPEELVFPVIMLPMVSPSIPWNSTSNGGYLYNKVDLIRIYKPIDSLMKSITDTNNTKFYPVFDSLNQLASTPWRINNAILDIMLEIFQKGGSDVLQIPKPASAIDVQAELSKYEKSNLTNYKKALIINRKKSEMHSLWCEMLYRLSLANHYRKRIFWLPHNVDFRGRAYPIPPHLSHIGSDLARSLLVFAKGKKLGLKGFDWLKIHCINLTGLKKKASIAERLAYANEILPDILDSAEKPLTGKMWWTNSEDLWQTLACCIEIKAVVDSGDPENFVSYFPVHQDGSCNGLQHYAALGRDQIGGKSVNVVPSSKPQDVYSTIVSIIERERAKDAKNGLEAAIVLEGYIQRKVIKQTVMTTVYGVTRYGARLQIQKQLKEINKFPTQHLRICSQYLTQKTFESLHEMFTSAREIQNWFVECADTIAKHYKNCVEWKTPLDFPVVQLYVKKGKEIKINRLKQKNAFPPNFVHSLDSSHMMLTSINCERNGITFVSVHDCFWTHPCSVELMNKICREQFVVLHSQPILENLSEFFIKRYSKNDSFTKNTNVTDIFYQVPKRGTLDLISVLDSEYFFS